jgi:hypothetical protein
MADILRCLKVGYEEWRAAHRVGEHEWRFEGVDGPFAAVVVSAIDRLDGRGLDVERLAEAIDAVVNAPDSGVWISYSGKARVKGGDIPAARRKFAAAILAAYRAASSVSSEPERLDRAEYARLRLVDDIARLLVHGWDSGFPVADGDSEPEIIARLRSAVEDGR